MMIAEARLRSGSREVPQTPNLRPLVLKNRLALSAVVLVVVSVLLLIVAYMAVLITIARIVTAASFG